MQIGIKIGLFVLYLTSVAPLSMLWAGAGLAAQKPIPLQVAQTDNGASIRTIANQSLGKCDPPRDISGCPQTTVKELLSGTYQLTNAPTIVLLPDGVSQYLIMPLETESAKVLSKPQGGCNPPADVSGCVVVPIGNLTNDISPWPNSAFKLQLQDGRTMGVMPTVKP